MRRDIQEVQVQKTIPVIVSDHTIYPVAKYLVKKALDSVVRGLGLGGYSRIKKEEGSGFTGLCPLNPEQRFPGPL